MGDWRHRETELARKALSDFCASAGNRCPACQERHIQRGKTIHIFSIPVDTSRDADFILDDVIKERDALRATLIDSASAICGEFCGTKHHHKLCIQAHAPLGIVLQPRQPQHEADADNCAACGTGAVRS